MVSLRPTRAYLAVPAHRSRLVAKGPGADLRLSDPAKWAKPAVANGTLEAHADRDSHASRAPQMIGFMQSPCDANVIRVTPAFDAAPSQRRKRLTLAATIFGSSMALVDGSVVNIALPTIQHVLHASVAATQWIVNAYLLLLSATVLVGGAAADLYGRRRIFVFGITIFTLASITCGLSPNITVLVASRAIQGVGAAFLIPASLAMLGATFDEHERNHAIGVWAGVGALTAAIGPVLGGWLVDQVSWRAIFLLNVPLAAVAAGLASFAGESRNDSAKSLDWTGAATIAAALASITWGLNAIPASGFSDRTVVGALGSGFLLLLLFLAIEARLGARAMMPLSLYGSRSFAAANALTLLLYFALGGALYYLPFGLIRLGGYSATQAGAALLPFALIMGFGAQFAGMLSDRFGPQQSLTFGPVIAGCGLALLAFADFRQSYWAGAFPAICVFGIGMTITVPPLTSMVMSSVGDAHAGLASGVNNAVARVAGLFAVAALGAVLFASFSYHLAGAPRAQANEALNAILAGQAGITEAATAAFERALRIVLQVAALCSLLGGILLRFWIRPIGSQAAR
ncbi:Drug resistance transporter, EmrB/QacA subfamily [Bradyrhizobium vignae]|uniref:Drug resistance transporter, EmrB/QacA subfamily n=2 Tax=Bradyrhizobium vignae TaxID=1549949 RepID=A0A2U3PTB2_9BRAD|nr:Drug resistance transporter, EmrB/QacA subfamily [Bradyrhizobium vignae]